MHLGYTLLTVLYMVGIFMLSSMPAGTGDETIDIIPPVVSNLLHVPLFAGLALLTFLAISGGNWQKPVAPTVYWLVLVVGLGYSVFDEVHQSYVPGRSASVLDVVLNLVGIVGVIGLHRYGRQADPGLMPD